MLRIGEAAKKYSISNRTLRYWEDMGILKSTRTENDYRYYDDENISRIKQIVSLRRLKIPIADIERIFLTSDVTVAIDVLCSHLDYLKRDTTIYIDLIANVEMLIQCIRDVNNVGQVFSYLEANNVTDLGHNVTPQNYHLERMTIMTKESLVGVRIVRLPAMTVASYCATSTTPEEDCSKVFNKFVLESNLHIRDGYRYFGFNNPSPTEGNQIYGYEMWVTIPEDYSVSEPMMKKQYNGGLYASVSTKMNEIGERWQALHEWCKNSKDYDVDFSHQWLEECSMDFERFISDDVSDNEKQLDLMHPIKQRQ